MKFDMKADGAAPLTPTTACPAVPIVNRYLGRAPRSAGGAPGRVEFSWAPGQTESCPQGGGYGGPRK